MKFDAAGLDIYLAHRDRLIDYALPIVGCRLRAEDVVQDAYLRFSAALGRQDAVAETSILQPVSYLYRIVRNQAIDLARHLSMEAPAPPPEVLVEIPANAPSPEQSAVDRDRIRVVSAALDDLPARTRRAFEMRRFEELTYQEIADRLGLSVGMAHRLVKDALLHCADRLRQAD